MWIYHLIRWSVAPSHSTAWAATQTIATLVGAIAAAVYLYVTYGLLRETRRASQTALMQQLMVEYDSLRAHVMALQSFRDDHGGTDEMIRIFANAVDLGPPLAQKMTDIDAHRFAVSRFFVKARKLANAGFLDRRLLAIALQRAAIQDVFLNLVDRLDQVITVKHHGKSSVADRDFYQSLLTDLPQLVQ